MLLIQLPGWLLLYKISYEVFRFVVLNNTVEKEADCMILDSYSPQKVNECEEFFDIVGDIIRSWPFVKGKDLQNELIVMEK